MPGVPRAIRPKGSFVDFIGMGRGWRDARMSKKIVFLAFGQNILNLKISNSLWGLGRIHKD
jgi:hypothetical protein